MALATEPELPPRPLLRHPSEIPTLKLVLGIAVIIGVVLQIYFPGTAPAILVVVVLQYAVAARQVSATCKAGRSIDHFPELREIARRCRERLSMRRAVNVLVVDDPVTNAFAAGLLWPRVVISTGIVRNFDPAELSFVIGHELGHVKLRHTLVSGLVGPFCSAPSGVRSLQLLFLVMFLSWSRLAECSADRAGLLACGDLSAATRALVKVNLGLEEASQVNVDQLLRHWQQHDTGFLSEFRAAFSTHPHLSSRVDRMVDWWTGHKP